MKDVFYTVLVVWIVWRIINAINLFGEKRKAYASNQSNQRHSAEGKTSIKYAPHSKQKISDDEGEYVDFEEVK